MAVAPGIVLALGLLLLVYFGLRGGELQKVRRCRLICPRFHEPVECRIVRNVRTGQWREVERCSVFRPSDCVLCAGECVRLMNLGLLRTGR
jgi:hypothetical protein